MLNTYNGMKIIVNKNLSAAKLVQVKFPRSKKKRIRKKFSNNIDNFAVKIDEPVVYKLGDTLFMNDYAYNQLKNTVS